MNLFNELGITLDNSFAQLSPDFFSLVTPSPLRDSQLAHANKDAAVLLGLDSTALSNPAFAEAFSGSTVPEDFTPLAMAYSGHQFGQYNPQLGDGRGLLLGETINEHGRWDIHLKGAGKTPYSRFGDGRAVLRSSIREYLASEALHHLGIPTTRALALFSSNQPVQREYTESGALLVRLARSHIRFGHFELFHYTNRHDKVKELADYVIDRHFSGKRGADKDGTPNIPDSLDKSNRENIYAEFLTQCVLSTAEMITWWQSLGFTHGVMNTDNMSILGDTFDYGPYGFMDDYDPDFVCNHSDHQRRYAFSQQPSIGLWNLNALGHALSSLLSADEIRDSLSLYEPHLKTTYSRKMRDKLGLTTEQDSDVQLMSDWLKLLEEERADFTRSFRALCDFTSEPEATNQAITDQFINRDGFNQWAEQYKQRLQQENSNDTERQASMCQHNPKYILRNYLAQNAIEKAEQGNFSEVDNLMSLLRNPYEEQPENEAYAAAPPDSAKGLALSCSS